MKKTLFAFLLAVMAVTLTACAGLAKNSGTAGGGSVPAPTATPDWSDILTASATDAAASGSHTPPASGTNTQSAPADQQAYEKALACVGRSVQELYAAVGQPAGTPTYGPSCLQEGAEDGMLSYDGFSVWTVRTGTEETVHEVYLNED